MSVSTLQIYPTNLKYKNKFLLKEECTLTGTYDYNFMQYDSKFISVINQLDVKQKCCV